MPASTSSQDVRRDTIALVLPELAIRCSHLVLLFGSSPSVGSSMTRTFGIVDPAACRSRCGGDSPSTACRSGRWSNRSRKHSFDHALHGFPARLAFEPAQSRGRSRESPSPVIFGIGDGVLGQVAGSGGSPRSGRLPTTSLAATDDRCRAVRHEIRDHAHVVDFPARSGRKAEQLRPRSTVNEMPSTARLTGQRLTSLVDLDHASSIVGRAAIDRPTRAGLEGVPSRGKKESSAAK